MTSGSPLLCCGEIVLETRPFNWYHYTLLLTLPDFMECGAVVVSLLAKSLPFYTFLTLLGLVVMFVETLMPTTSFGVVTIWMLKEV